MLKPLAATLLLVVFSWFASAQTPNEYSQIQSLPDSLIQTLPLPDSLLNDKLIALDSIHSDAKSSFDELKYSYDSITSIANNASSKLQQQIDNLNNQKLPTDKLTTRLDSIAQWKETQLAKVEDKIQGLKTKVDEKISSLDLPDELKDKASAFTTQLDKLDVSFPETSFPQMELPDNLPALKGMENPLSDFTPELPDMNIGDANLGEITGQVNSYTNTVTDVIPENINDIPATLETHATDALQVDAVQEQIGEVAELSEMVGQLNNEEYVQEQLKNQVQQQAFDHFAGKQEQLEKAMDTMSKYKRKYEDIQSVADLPKKIPNAMRGKPFVERLVPGIAIQIHQQDAWLFDFNPYIGYRFSGRLTAGLGWNQRISYNFDTGNFQNEQVIFGPRIYTDILMAKGFGVRLEGEYMKTLVPSQFSTGQTDAHGREWVFSTMAGLKKDYRFLKRIKGTVMLLYNIYDPHHRSPYGDKLNMRFGFEYILKSKAKKKP